MMKHKKWMSSVVLTAFMLTNMNIPAYAAEVGNTATDTRGYTVDLSTTPQVATGSAITPVPSGSVGTNETGKADFSVSPSQTGHYRTGAFGDYLSYVEDNDKTLTISKSMINTDSGQMTKAFGEDSYVEHIILEDGVSNIIDNAFSQCTNLQSVYIADSVTEIGNDPFTNYDNLTIYGSVGSAAEQYAQEAGIPFYPAAVNETHTLLYAAQPVETVAVNETTTGTVTVRNADGTAGGRVTWSVADESMLEILETSYDAATGSTTVQLFGLQAGETTITASAEDGTSLTETVTVTRAGEVQTGALGETVSWTLADGVLTISGTGTATGRLDYNVLRLVQELVVEEGITAFGDYIFENCSALTKVTLPSTLTSIGKGAFSNCRALREFQVPETITSIEEYAFIGCTSLEHIYIPATVTSIARWAFNGCSLLSIYGVAGSYAETYALQYDIPFSTQVQGSDGSLIYIDQDSKVLAVGGTMNLTATGNSTAVDWTVSDDTILKIVDAAADGSSVQLQGLKAGEATVTATANGASTSRTIQVLDTFGTCGDNLTWNFANGVLTISGGGEMKERPWYFLADQIRTVIVEEGITTIQVCAFSGFESLTTVNLPSTLTEIGEVAFESCSAVQQIIIPASVTKIGSGAFRGCSSLTEVVIPAGVTAIEMQTFAECTALNRVVLPERLQSIGDYAFGRCPSLAEINLPDTLTTIGNNVFVGGESLQTIVLPDSLTSIGSAVFSGCQNLREVTFPVGLKTIPQSMFMCCISLQNVTLPNALEIIENDAFSGCESFTTLTFPANVTSIGDRAFYGCTNITEIYFLGNAPQTGNLGFLDASLSGATAYYPADNATWTALSAMDRAEYGGFYIEWMPLGEVGQVVGVELDRTAVDMVIGDILQLQATVMPDTAIDKTLTWSSSDQTVATVNADGVVTALQTGSATITVTTNDGGYTAECTVSVTENSSIESGYCNFYGTDSGRNIYWTYEPDTGVLTLQGEGEIIDFYVDSAYSVPAAFHEATTVILEEGITRIGKNVFAKCDNIENLVIADSVTEIGTGAFQNCSGLKNVRTGDGITSLDVFRFGPALEHIEIGAGITEIPDRQFQNCTSLSEVTIPNQITRIGNSAFEGCTSLQEVVIPAAVQELGTGIFKACTGLQSAEFLNSPVTLGDELFADCVNLNEVVLSPATTELGARCFANCSGLKQVDFLDQIIKIGVKAFENCTGLTSIALRENMTDVCDYAFQGCHGLRTVRIPGTVLNWGIGVFSGCIGLLEVTIDNIDQTSGAQMFQGCSNLTTIHFSETVDRIPAGAFADCAALESVTFPVTLKQIGDNAFQNCRNLRRVNFVNGLDSIGAYAFQGCALSKLELPNSVTTVGDYAFSNCEPLEQVILSNGLHELEACTFDGCPNIRYVDTGDGVISLKGFYRDNFAHLETFIVGNNVTDLIQTYYPDIEDPENPYIHIFRNCKTLKTFIMGSAVTNIAKETFKGCSGLSDITIGGNVTEIKANAFKDCTALTELIIPDSVSKIDNTAFSGCTALRFLDTGNGISNLDMFDETNLTVLEYLVVGAKTISNNKFSGCKTLKAVEFGTNVETIGSNAFKDCVLLTELEIPDNVISIQKGAFDGCTALQAVNTGNGISNLDGFNFSNSQALREIVIGDCIETIPSSTFNKCAILETVKIGNSVKEIGSYAFANCGSLNDISIPDSVTTISSNAFANCSSFTQIEIPSNVYSIGGNAFANCQNLNSVVLNEGLQYINSGAFSNCASLTSIDIPDSVVDVGDSSQMAGDTGDAFAGCTNLAEILIGDGIKSLDSFDFPAYAALQKVSVGDGVKTISDNTFAGCAMLERVILGQSVNSIQKTAFADCNKLRIVMIPDSVKNIAPDAFSNSANVKIYGYKGSYAETFAKDHNIPFTTLTAGDVPSPNGTLISILAQSYELGIGEDKAIPLMYEITPEAAKNQSVTWEITDKTIVRSIDVLDGRYWIEGLKSGITTITAITADGASSTREITVKNSVQSSNGTSISMDTGLVCELGKTLDIGASALYPTGNVCKTNWSVGDKTIVNIQKVLTNGTEEDSLGCSKVRVEGLKLGETTITATTEDGASVTQIISVKETLEVDDERNPKTEINISDPIEVGHAYDLEAYFNSVLPVSNSNVKWSVAPENLVYFSEENAVLVGLRPGTITLTATRQGETLSKTVTIEDNQQTGAKIVTKDVFFRYENGSYDTEELPFIVIIVNGTDTAQEEQLTFTVDVPGVKFKDKFLFVDTETEKLTSKKFTVQPGEVYVYEGVVTVKDFVPEQKTYKQEVVITCARQQDYTLSSEFTVVNYDSTSADNPCRPGSSSKPGNYTPRDFKTEEQREAATWMQQLYNALAEIENTEKVAITVNKDDIKIGLGTKGIFLDEQAYEKITKNILFWRALKGSEMMKETSGYNKNNYYLKLSGIKTTNGNDVVLLVKDDTYLNLSWGKLNSIECIAYVNGEKKAKTLLGVTVEGDPKAFAKEVRNYAQRSRIENLENFSKEIMKDVTFEAIKNQTENEFLKSIVEVCQYYEKYFADTKDFMETLGEVNMAVITAREYTAALEQQLNGSYEAVIEVACPVDVYVYDSKGNLYGQIINNQIDESVTVIPMWVEGESKFFKVFDEDYTVKLVGNDVGTMDYIIREYEDGENISRLIKFFDLPLTEGKTYTGTVPSEAYMPSEVYALVADTGEVIQKDTDTYQRVGLSGTITSYGDANAETTIRLLQDNAEVYTTTGTGNSISYTFPAVAAGTYEMEVSKQGHATYHETITVGSEGLTKDITIYLLGDVTGDGKVTSADKAYLARHLAEWPGYEQFPIGKEPCDIDKNEKINSVDKALLSRYIAGWPGSDKYFN